MGLEALISQSTGLGRIEAKWLMDSDALSSKALAKDALAKEALARRPLVR